MSQFQCHCGTVRGQIEGQGIHNHLICYCTDCQAFARYLGEASDVLDAQGGTEIVQLGQPRLRFLQGEDRLAAVRLSEKGLVRWYTTCCRTPIGNTLSNPQVSVIGLVHACLDSARINEEFGPLVAAIDTATALGEPKPKPSGLLGVIARSLSMVLANLVSGRYRQSPLFKDSGAPRVEPEILTPAELARLKGSA